eukprot:scaffold9196_cov110-Isochrysis_galbana.AAC.6
MADGPAHLFPKIAQHSASSGPPPLMTLPKPLASRKTRAFCPRPPPPQWVMTGTDSLPPAAREGPVSRRRREAARAPFREQKPPQLTSRCHPILRERGEVHRVGGAVVHNVDGTWTALQRRGRERWAYNSCHQLSVPLCTPGSRGRRSGAAHTASDAVGEHAGAHRSGRHAARDGVSLG